MGHSVQLIVQQLYLRLRRHHGTHGYVVDKYATRSWHQPAALTPGLGSTQCETIPTHVSKLVRTLRFPSARSIAAGSGRGFDIGAFVYPPALQSQGHGLYLWGFDWMPRSNESR